MGRALEPGGAASLGANFDRGDEAIPASVHGLNEAGDGGVVTERSTRHHAPESEATAGQNNDGCTDEGAGAPVAGDAAEPADGAGSGGVCLSAVAASRSLR